MAIRDRRVARPVGATDSSRLRTSRFLRRAGGYSRSTSRCSSRWFALRSLTNASLEIWFFYQEHKTSLIRIQHEQAEAASGKIGQFIKEIEAQLGWTTQLPWTRSTLEQRRVDAVRLLRQVPAITELAQIDPSGTERLRVSRLATTVIDTHIDASKD